MMKEEFYLTISLKEQVDAQKLSNALEAITDQCPPELRELNTQIKKFLNDFLKPNSANNAVRPLVCVLYIEKCYAGESNQKSV